MLIKRTIYDAIKKSVISNDSVTILYGPRQVGKTTLIKQLQTELPPDLIYFATGDDLRIQEIFGQAIEASLKNLLAEKKYLIIDEAQRIENIGLTLKLIHDILNLKILVSGSSSFDLANKINEPLTGRTKTFFLYPLSWLETHQNSDLRTNQEKIEGLLRFGGYPKSSLLTNEKDKEDYLYEVINNYLYRDLLSFENIRKPKKVIDLLSLLALQIGSEVSIQNLSNDLGITKVSVENYLDILEKMFVIYNLRGFSRNLRSEVTKTSKYFFFDLGIRNALIRNFNPLKLRNDAGGLFENFAIMERKKYLDNSHLGANLYFWRTYAQNKIDLLEEREGKLRAFEFKLKPGPTSFKTFTAEYPNSESKLITPNNFGELN